MMNIDQIWSNRFGDHVKEVSRYLRYMFNDHLMIVLLIAFSAGAIYYKGWLTQLSNPSPYIWLVAVVLGIFISASPIRSFLKEADLVFLLPVEHKMDRFFQKGFIYSYILQSSSASIIYIIFIPLLLHIQDRSPIQLLMMYILILLLKFWNSRQSWRMYYYIEKETRRSDYLLRLVFNIAFLFFLFSGASMIYLFMMVVIALLWHISFVRLTKDKSLKWELLLEEEAKLMGRFYRIANMFVDVPHLKNEIKSRKWLNWATGSIAYKQKNVYSMLYAKTFIRSGEFLGIFTRLFVIAGLLVYVMDYRYAGALIVPFFIYLSSLQLLSMYKVHENKIWLTIYPLSESTRQASFANLLMLLMVGKAMVLSAVVISSAGFYSAGVTFIVSVLFSYVFIQYYLKRKLKVT
ncbi:ABC transporter permease [Bacillus salitolerans]|uniref:ABC transporter permease n=1 Tax=Bacillus salitolerans TaxID=1437434 RepID=A0ABW4LY49_9BACI